MKEVSLPDMKDKQALPYIRAWLAVNSVYYKIPGFDKALAEKRKADIEGVSKDDMKIIDDL